MTTRTIQILSISLFTTLLVWALFVLLYYLGVPVHSAVLLPQDALSSLDSLCNPNAFLCRGVYGFFPFLIHALTRVPLFLWYTATCAVLFGITLVWGYLRTNRFAISWVMTPWKLLLLFVGMVWLLFTCLTLSQNGDLAFRLIVEPSSQVYQGTGPEALASLEKNYNELKDKGCLHKVGVFAKVAEASNIKIRCLQGTFFTRVLPPGLVLLLFLFEALIAGRLVLRRVLKLLPEEPLAEFIISMGVGFGAWIVALWLGAVLGIYTAYFGWALALLIPIIGYKDAQYWLTKFLRGQWTVEGPWYSVSILIAWFLLTYLAFNYINVIRPFPIGWDDLGSYLNRPRLLVSYGKFVHSMASFQWEYITSLGFLLFGYESVFGATTSLVLNWSEGLFAIFVILLFGRTFLGKGRGVLAAALYYTLPLVGHFSFADMKIDNAVFATGSLALFCLFYTLFGEQHDGRAQQKWFLLTGLLAGFAFSVKATAIMVFMAIGAVLLGALLHWTAFVGATLFAFAVFTKQGALNVPRLIDRLNVSEAFASPMLLIGIFLVLGTVLVALATYINRSQMKKAVLSTAIVVAGFAIMVLPWLWHNSILHGHITPRMALTAPNSLTPVIDMFGNKGDSADYVLPPELIIEQSHQNCKATAGTEELDRYWGNQIGWGHYLTLPWRTVMNLDHAGYYVTPQPMLLLFPLLLLLPMFWKGGSRWLRWLWIATVFLIVQWAFLANGVVWYGIGMFLGLVLCMEVLTARAPDTLSKTLTSILIALSLLVCFSMRLWQFETQRNLFEYAIGKVSAETMRERTIPYYDDITDVVLQRYETMPDRPLVYRIGTFMPYFVPKNLEVIGITDHQLDTFNCLYQERDPALTLQRLKALGFNSIIFDTNTATIEKNPQGSLHQKVNALVEFLNSPEAALQMVINDPGAGIAFLLIP